MDGGALSLLVRFIEGGFHLLDRVLRPSRLINVGTDVAAARTALDEVRAILQLLAGRLPYGFRSVGNVCYADSMASVPRYARCL